MKEILCDLVARIKNGVLARNLYVYAKQYSKLLEQFCKLLMKEGYIHKYEIVDLISHKKNQSVKKTIQITLRYTFPDNIKVSKLFNQYESALDNKKNDMIASGITPSLIKKPKISQFAISAIKNIKMISTPNTHISTSYRDIPNFAKQNQNATLIMSTSQGLMSAVEAINNKIGGKLFVRVE